MKKEEEDWRFQGQEQYLLGVDLVFKKYKDKTTITDHDHCEFCSSKFSTTIPNALIIGYTTLDEYHWICEKCFSDFKDKFNWRIKAV